MIIDLKNGKGLIEIGVAEGSYFKFNKPLSIVWPDRYGSVAQFLTISKRQDGYRNTVNGYTSETLYDDFTDNLQGAYHFIQPLLELFENGKHVLSFFNSDSKSSFDNFNEQYYYLGQTLHIPEGTDNRNELMQRLRHKTFLFQNLFTRKYYPAKLLDYSTYNFYDANDLDLVATQPKESIDAHRVQFFKKEIANGKRPFAIVACKTQSIVEQNADGTKTLTNYDSANFVLDGHHKLLAYADLKIQPPLLVITAIPDKIEELNFDWEAVKKVMFSWQYEHLCQGSK